MPCIWLIFVTCFEVPSLFFNVLNLCYRQVSEVKLGKHFNPLEIFQFPFNQEKLRYELTHPGNINYLRKLLIEKKEHNLSHTTNI